MNADDINILVDNYSTCIYGFCRRLTYKKEDAEDLYQQTFLKALELCDKIDMNLNPKGFLISIAINYWKNHTSKKRRHDKIVHIEEQDDDSQIENISDNENLEDVVQNNILYKQVADIVNLLPDKFKTTVIMYYTAEMSICDIAETLKIPEGTIKSRLYKSRCIIKERLERYGYDK